MPDGSRFDRLESAPNALPESVKAAVSKLDRFVHLEIGDAKPAPTPAPTLESPSNRVRCTHCGQSNEVVRDVCWACFKPLKAAAPLKPEPGQEVEIILDGHAYKSSDPALAPDIQVLIGRIREEGYSDDLLREWRQWRATRSESSATGNGSYQLATHEATAFQGQRVSILRIDGKVYHSDDAQVQPEIRELFDYIDKNGVTPELLDHLRRYGDQVHFRPHTTHAPSDGDINFWRSVAHQTDGPVPTLSSKVGYLRREFFPWMLNQPALALALSFGIPTILVIWVWWHYFNRVGQMVGNI